MTGSTVAPPRGQKPLRRQRTAGIVFTLIIAALVIVFIVRAILIDEPNA
jgi:hypothetical protein